MIAEPRRLSKRVFRLDNEIHDESTPKHATDKMFHIHVPDKNVPVEKENIVAKIASAFEHKEKLPRTPEEDHHSKQLSHNSRARNNHSHSAPKRKPRRNYAAEPNTHTASTDSSLRAGESHLKFEIETLDREVRLLQNQLSSRNRNSQPTILRPINLPPEPPARPREEHLFHRNDVAYDMSRYEPPPEEPPRMRSPAEQQRIYEIESKAIYFQNLEMRRFNRQRNTFIHLTGTCQSKNDAPSPTIPFPVVNQHHGLGDYVSDLDSQFWSYKNLKRLDSLQTSPYKASPQKPLPTLPTECEECAICLDNIERENATLPCKHHFHINCIEKWLVDHTTCPVCRAKVKR